MATRSKATKRPADIQATYMRDAFGVDRAHRMATEAFEKSKNEVRHYWAMVAHRVRPEPPKPKGPTPDEMHTMRQTAVTVLDRLGYIATLHLGAIHVTGRRPLEEQTT